MELTEQSLKLLKDYYMKEYEKSPEEAFKEPHMPSLEAMTN